MKQYIGTKRVLARPMNRRDYNDYRGWALPENENGDDEGYLVEYMDGGVANHLLHKGYISWSPKEVFERAYSHTENMDFGSAIRALKQGAKVTRSGWNGKGMWLILVPGSPEINTFPNTPYYNAGIEKCEILPHIDMWTVNAEGRRAMLPGWLASQSDMLAEDWMVVQ